MDNSYHFTSVMEESNNKLWGAHFAVPQFVTEALTTKGEAKRVVCILNEKEKFQCALLPRGDGSYLISVNKKLRDKFGLKKGSLVRAELQKDESEYGLPVAEEFAELMKQDEEGDRLFHALTPGKQRTLLYIVNQPKTSDKRLERSLVVLGHLKKMGGKIDFKILNLDLKEGV